MGPVFTRKPGLRDDTAAFGLHCWIGFRKIAERRRDYDCPMMHSRRTSISMTSFPRRGLLGITKITLLITFMAAVLMQHGLWRIQKIIESNTDLVSTEVPRVTLRLHRWLDWLHLPQESLSGYRGWWIAAPACVAIAFVLGWFGSKSSILALLLAGALVLAVLGETAALLLPMLSNLTGG